MTCSNCHQNGHNIRTCPRRTARRQRRTYRPRRPAAAAPAAAAYMNRPTTTNISTAEAVAQGADFDGLPVHIVLWEASSNETAPIATYHSIAEYESVWETHNCFHLRWDITNPRIIRGMAAVVNMRDATTTAAYRQSVQTARERNHHIRPRAAQRAAGGAPVKKQVGDRIKNAMWAQLEEADKSCPVCLNEITRENFALSLCGHNYCSTCFNDPRLTKCGICREEL
jgi:hypothetical protein